MKLTEKNYIERDVSWMAFNYRILAEAQREDIPLMERLNFLGIYSNNLDEFFRVRVATLSRIVAFGGQGADCFGRRHYLPDGALAALEGGQEETRKELRHCGIARTLVRKIRAIAFGRVGRI